jgi:hypothetical protein
MSYVTLRSQAGGSSVRLLGLYLADDRVGPDSVQSDFAGRYADSRGFTKGSRRHEAQSGTG